MWTFRTATWISAKHTTKVVIGKGMLCIMLRSEAICQGARRYWVAWLSFLSHSMASSQLIYHALGQGRATAS